MRSIKPLFALVFLCALAACGGRERPGAALPTPAFAGDVATRNAIAKQLFGAESVASRQSPDPYGSYAKGCLAGGMQLAETGPTWQAMRLSRNRNWGHPETIAYIQDLSRKAAGLPGWNGLYVGDISQPRGGPMLTGHASHQIGLDADIWLRPADRLNLSVNERENISSISLRRAAGAYTNDNWTRAHHELLKAAASDPRVARIFIFPGAKVRMCNDETGSKAWLNKIRPWYGHHYHFHVRLKCPRGARGCVDQDPQPAGDGCADAQAWVNNILNPPPPDPNYKPKPKREIRMADLPGQCQSVLSQ
ncbi:penicillin-insensitive murein endopeptidase [Oceaniglobus trochenteri]|uniref:penicillin-insensitive murein endopeptidase n=1 Tax=Oceaniglobus trochenteri TaxID=2763260 RepID=UPI001CFF9074|nr:penicillin-insensitive murein endopeptidase [Oceaniglobus trochenteri]